MDSETCRNEMTAPCGCLIEALRACECYEQPVVDIVTTTAEGIQVWIDEARDKEEVGELARTQARAAEWLGPDAAEVERRVALHILGAGDGPDHEIRGHRNLDYVKAGYCGAFVRDFGGEIVGLCKRPTDHDGSHRDL